MPDTATKERPILFSGEMVRAILDGRKMQTRRVVKPQPIRQHHIDYVYDRRHWCVLTNHASVVEHIHCPYGQPGDRLRVNESFYFDFMPWANGGSLKTVPEECRDTDLLYYPADATGPGNWCCQLIPECCCAEVGKPKLRPARFMPKWASRITLEITNVRVERLQEISDRDAFAEGIDSYCRQPLEDRPDGTARGAFRDLWDSINAASGCGWDANPWVWVVEFKRLEADHA